MKKFLDFAGDVFPYLIVGLVFIVTIASLVSLVLVDVITGQITGDYLSGDGWFGLFSSLAGTGLIIATGAFVSKTWEKKSYSAAILVGIIFLLLQAADVYFDGISVDIKRFGMLISTSAMNRQEAIAHNIYRFFIAGISFVGEPLGVASVAAFPALKKWLMSMLGLKGLDSSLPPKLPPNLSQKSLSQKRFGKPYRPVNSQKSTPSGDLRTPHFFQGDSSSKSNTNQEDPPHLLWG